MELKRERDSKSEQKMKTKQNYQKKREKYPPKINAACQFQDAILCGKNGSVQKITRDQTKILATADA